MGLQEISMAERISGQFGNHPDAFRIGPVLVAQIHDGGVYLKGGQFIGFATDEIRQLANWLLAKQLEYEKAKT